MTNFDGIELHPIFPQTLMNFDGNQPIRILFWNDEMMFTKQKHMIIKKTGKGKISKMSKKLIWTNEIIEELIELLFCPF